MYSQSIVYDYAISQMVAETLVPYDLKNEINTDRKQYSPNSNKSNWKETEWGFDVLILNAPAYS